MSIILASASPRRRELLELSGREEFYVMNCNVDETVENWTSSAQFVREIARRKAQHAIDTMARDFDVVISADTAVFVDGKALGKPNGPGEALDMLTALSGRTHEVCTAVCVGNKERIEVRHQSTLVTFRPLTRDEILEYIATGEPLDRAGAYAIQGGAARFVTGIEGDYFSVVGLPVCMSDQMLKEFGV
ncbi:MAG: septum formation protein Maf [Oscillospiraceae bacterium]|nr:septum formation protein Maf [Oscillospiraceae bacterium]